MTQAEKAAAAVAALSLSRSSVPGMILPIKFIHSGWHWHARAGLGPGPACGSRRRTAGVYHDHHDVGS
jgi:hypothetical protein